MLDDAYVRIAGVVLGQRAAERINDKRIITKNAVDEILKYYHFKPVEAAEEMEDVEEQLDYSLRTYGLMRRQVELEDGWYKDAYGPVLAFSKETGMPYALLPGMIFGYWYTDPETGKREKVTAKKAQEFQRDAMCFYRPLPPRKLGVPDLIMYMKRCMSMSDIIMMVVAAYAVMLVGLLMPRIIKALTGPVLSSGRYNALIGIAVCMVCVAASTQLLEAVNGMIQGRLETKTSMGVEASMMMRLMSLPASFFRNYNEGELKTRSMAVNSLCSLLLGMVLSTGLTSVSSLVYITQIFRFSPVLVVPSLVIILVTVLFSILSTFVQIRVEKRQLEVSARESGMSYAMLTGVRKIKLAGAEKRIFAKWLNLYAESAGLTYNPPLFIKLNSVISTGITLVSNIVLYYLAVTSGIEQSSYFAFMAAYGVVMGAFMSMSGVALNAARIRPILEMAEPLLRTEPEKKENREIVKSISGDISLEHVWFRYSEDTPYILEDLSIRIRPGEYVAIVGKTGCGKSTLMRLLLGFEQPEKGTVYYDGKDIESLELSSLRKNIGTVTQSGGLFQGDIYSNITISAPNLTMDEAWEAAEKAGVAEDIRQMPMGMYTIISEGQGGISGGQKQRIMIARAIAPKPKLLLFDEATSALDNKTQSVVSEALDEMGCTRVVIAHRLSTIRHCDRILVLDGGKIIEEGNYEELIKKNGFFAELVERQRLQV